MTDIAELGFRADSSSLRTAATDLDRVSGAARRTENAASRMERQIQAGFRALQGAFAALGVSAAVRQIIAIDDAYAQVEGRLRLVTTGTENLARIQEELFGIAQRTGVAYEETANLYAKVAKNAEALGLSQQQLLDFTEATNQAIQVSGASAIEAAGGVRQLGQALASGALRGDEFNSLAENMPRLRDAIADGLGISIGELRKFAAEGKLTADVVTQALLSQSDVIEREFQALPVTVGRAMTEFENEVKRAIAEADTQPLVDAIRELQSTLSDPAVIAGIANIAGGLVTLARWSAEAATGVATLTTNVGEYAAQLSGGGSVVTDTERFIKLLEQMRDRSGWQNAALSIFPGAVDVRYLAASNDELEREIALQRQALAQLDEFGVSARENSGQIAEMRSQVITLQRAIAERRGWRLPTDELEEQLAAVRDRIVELQSVSRTLTIDRVADAVAEPFAEIDRIVNGSLQDMPLVLRQAANGFGEVGENAGIVAQKTKIAADETKKLTDAEQKAIDKLREQIAILERENELLDEGRTLEEARFIAAYEAADELERLRLIQEQRQQGYIDKTREAAEVEEELVKKAKEATDEIIRQQQLRAEQIQRAWERVAGGVENAWRTAFRSTLRGFEGFEDEVLRGAEDLVVELALVLARQQLIIPVTLSIGGMLGLNEGALGNLGNALGLGGNPLNTLIGGFFGGGSSSFSGLDALSNSIVTGIEDAMYFVADTFGVEAAESFGDFLTANGNAIVGGLSNALMGLAGAGALYGAGSGLAVPNSRVSPGLQGLGAVLAPAFSLPATILDSLTGGGLFGTSWQTVGQELAISIQDQIADATLQTIRERERSLWRGTDRDVIEDGAYALDRQLSEAFGLIYDSIADGAARIGLAAGSFSFEFDQSIAGLSEDEVSAVISGALSDATDSFIRQTVPGIEQMRRAGESLQETFGRVVTGFEVVQSAIDMFGLSTTVRQSVIDATNGVQQFFMVFAPGGSIEDVQAARDAMDGLVQATPEIILRVADALTELAGSAEQLQANISNFWDDFASDEQKANRIAELSASLFDSLGLTLPDTRAGLFELVQSLDIFTESGQEAFHALTASSDLLDAYFDNLERGAETAVDAIKPLQGLIDGLQGQIADIERQMAVVGLSGADLDRAGAGFALEDNLAAAGANKEAQGLARELYELQLALIDAQEAAEQAAAAESQRSALERQLLDLLGDTAAIRELELAALDPSNHALQLRIWALEDEAEAAAAAARAAEELAREQEAIASERQGLERQILQLQGDTAALRAIELAALAPANQALQVHIWALQDAATAAQAAAQQEQTLASLRIRLAQAQGDTYGATRLQREQELAQAATEAERALLRQIYAAEDQAAAAQAAAASVRDLSSSIRDIGDAVAEERGRLETELLQLVGAEAELRRRERNELDASNRALYDQVNALRDQRDAVDEAVRMYTDLASGIASFGDSINLAANDAVGISLSAARAQFADIARRARLSDVDALASFTAVGEQLRQASEAQAESQVEYLRDLARLRNEAELAEATALRQADLAEASFDELARQTLLLAGIQGELASLRGEPSASVAGAVVSIPQPTPIVISAPNSTAGSRPAQSDPETQRVLTDIRRLLQQLYDNSEEGMQTGVPVRAFETSGLLTRDAA